MTDQTTKRVILEGPFTEADIAEIAAVLRHIDERNPTATFLMSFDNPDMSLDDSEALLRRVLSPLPNRATDFARASYHDDSYPERACDHCHQPYRGPAVYCSLECALQDSGSA